MADIVLPILLYAAAAWLAVGAAFFAVFGWPL